MFNLSEERPDSFPKQLHHLTLALATYEVPISSPTLVIVYLFLL